MSDLRADLEQLADDMAYDVTDAPARIRAVLAKHPAKWEPFEARYAAEPVGVSDEAVEKAATACRESDFAWSSEGIHDEYWRKMARAALEAAALPHLQPQPVAASREMVAEVLAAHNIECTGPGEVTCRGCRDKSWMSWSAYRLHLSEAIFALVRPLPTREQIAEALDRPAFVVDGYYETAGARRRREYALEKADAVLALLRGE